MSGVFQKTIRPTKLQPQLYSIIKQLAKEKDYKIIIDKDNQPICVLLDYGLFEELGFQDKFDSEKLAKEAENYYQNIPEEEQELIDLAIDDGIS